MDIKRDKYLTDLINRMNNGMIKVVTGIRRCGKSYLIFTIFKNYLKEQGIDESHIVTIELDQRKDKKYRDPDVILEYIESRIIDDEQFYILLDEVQLLEDFEEVLNSLLHIKIWIYMQPEVILNSCQKMLLLSSGEEEMKFIFFH